MANSNMFRDVEELRLRQMAFNIKNVAEQLESAKYGEGHQAAGVQPKRNSRGKKKGRGTGRGSSLSLYQHYRGDDDDYREAPRHYGLDRSRSRGRGLNTRGRQPYPQRNEYEDYTYPGRRYDADDRSCSPPYPGPRSFEGPPSYQQEYSYERSYQQSRFGRGPSDRSYGKAPIDRSYKPAALGPKELVDALVSYPDFSTSLLLLMEENGFPPSQVRELTRQYPKVFELSGEEVELRPEITICAEHSGPEGCQERTSCMQLHLCHKLVRNECRNPQCVLGHKWKTDHNLRVLRSCFLGSIPIPRIQKLFEKGLPSAAPTGKVSICEKYNTSGCDEDCSSLHICFKFVVGRTKCQRKNCPLNHNLMTDKCSRILSSRGFSTNESPRDIVAAILAANPDLAERDDQKSPQFVDKSKLSEEGRGKSENISEERKKKSENISEKEMKKSENISEKKMKKSNISENKTKKKKISEDTSDTSEDDTTEGDSDSSDSSDNESNSSDIKSPKKKPIKKSAKISEKKEKLSSDNSDSDQTVGAVTKDLTKIVDKKTETKPKLRTLWSNDFLGDVSVPEICFYSVEGMCRKEVSGCERLHASEHFHWQVQEQGQHWINLPELQVVALERAFCDPAKDSVDLPRLDPATLKPTARGLLILMGRDTWSADFKLMTLTNSTKSKTLSVRRLCTENVDGMDIEAATFSWHFLDIKNKWIAYGKVDTTGDSSLVVSASSKDIEKQYLQNPKGTYSFQSPKFHYVLDFQAMTQTNQKTRVSREVRRRPVPHLKDDTKQSSEDENKPKDLPSSWEIMQKEERVRLVTLAPSSSEYQTVDTFLSKTLPNRQLMKIERIQNPYLWRAYENKVKELTTVLGDATKVDVRQLFHGTKQDVTSSICSENFDWRLHGSSVGQMYGRGTYFATSASYSYNYSVPDANRLRYMFVARVAVGAFTRGNPSMVRPPPNPATGTLYDSTVDQEPTPTIIVKYDKQEYYPEYLLTLT